ncbi:hypothetical protein [Allomuricauda sp. NBRC 101325]|uniref:hypothetical protein n=1 Tax=Allomuricauda sp. NBRC 101325 TaxID=1113758 RepID=UPI0024A21F5F|nr:hypothetical protein [Muricauda sp. NBRC 101325]GLU43762.1 hypothetical protein Musp01_13860 [Muricauda sp. NBRC 101325]
MRNIFLILSLIISINSWGQIGVVTDSDGYLNVRVSPSGKVIDTLQEGEVFFISVDSEDSIWVAIEYGEDYKTGFVHYSRIIEITKLETPTENTPELIFNTKPAKESENRNFYGGMNLPLTESFELYKIEIVQNVDTIQQDCKYSKDVLTPFLPSGIYSSSDLVSNGKLKIYSYKEFVYYRMRLGDGSEYYESIWVVKNGKIIQRLIGWIV